MPECTACGSHVTTDYRRVFAGADGEVYGCPACTGMLSRLSNAG